LHLRNTSLRVTIFIHRRDAESAEDTQSCEGVEEEAAVTYVPLLRTKPHPVILNVVKDLKKVNWDAVELARTEVASIQHIEIISI
jgi:hypothetical protein